MPSTIQHPTIQDFSVPAGDFVFIPNSGDYLILANLSADGLEWEPIGNGGVRNPVLRTDYNWIGFREKFEALRLWNPTGGAITLRLLVGWQKDVLYTAKA